MRRGWIVGLVLLAAFCISVVPAPVCRAGPEESPEHERLKKAEQEERRILAELEDLEKNASRVGDRLIELEEEIKNAEKKMDQGDRNITRLEDRLKKMQSVVNQRLRAIYKMRDGGLLPILLKAESITDLLNRYRYLSLILKQDQELIADFVQNSRDLKNQRIQAVQNRDRLIALRSNLDGEKKELIELRHQKTALLMKVHQRKELYLAMIRQQEESRRLLLKEVTVEPMVHVAPDQPEEPKAPNSTPKEEKPSDPAPRNWPDFAGMKGNIPRPVKGYITKRFGRSKGRFNLLTTRHGVVMTAVSGKEVRAVLDGEVMYTGWLKGYGNIIILNHGKRYYTLTGGLSGMNRNPGEWVRQGDILGFVPKDGKNNKKGIYFEIRHQGRALDPALWLSKKSTA